MSARPAVETVVEPRMRDIGDFAVRRLLPAAARRSVGPFVFLDHFGPVAMTPGQGMDVRPHPHIGLATVTYLLEGEVVHRDSLGYVQPIRPGDINWMIAGRGIVHSERSSVEERAKGPRLHGIQSWVALPVASEESDPRFAHHPAASLPAFTLDGARLRLIAGAGFGHQAPVAVLSPTLYVDVELQAGARLTIPREHPERAIYVISGVVEIDGESHGATRLLVLAGDDEPRLTSKVGARCLLLGGAPLDGHRHLYWNFVSSRRERIDQAKSDWSAGRFPKVPGETDYIPLPA
jgi:redox-sensitive bicupin YhaK (pirin superfamily)